MHDRQHHHDDAGARAMTSVTSAGGNVTSLDEATSAIVWLAAEIAAGSEGDIRSAMIRTAASGVRPEWVEELILQSYLFAGFPRTLNAMREWRRASGRQPPADDEGTGFERADEWHARGERTCAIVYGPMYKRLRVNIGQLHPALDSWMIVDGYGKVLSRPALDLMRRELCIVSVCAAADQERQLHSHLHGALHSGATREQLESVLQILAPRTGPERHARYRHLLARVEGGRSS